MRVLSIIGRGLCFLCAGAVWHDSHAASIAFAVVGFGLLAIDIALSERSP